MAGDPGCLFCKIVAGTIKATIVAQDPDWLAFTDLAPQAPHHVLVVPKRHVATVNDLRPADDALVGAMVRAARGLAKTWGVDAAGYRLVMNCNADGGQSVYHLHLHLLAGRRMTWPPG